MQNELLIIPYTLIGSASGAGAITLINYFVQKYQKKMKNFENELSIQLSLNQMLAISLQLYQHYEKSKERFLEYNAKILKAPSPTETWKKIRFFNLSKFNQTLAYINLDWDFSQFLSKTENEDRDREILEHIIPARSTYLDLNSILEIRNNLLNKALKIYEKDHTPNHPSDFEFKKDDLKKMLGDKLYFELDSTTDHYVSSLKLAPQSIHNAFIRTYEHITSKYKNYTPLKLKLDEHLRKLLDKIVEPEK